MQVSKQMLGAIIRYIIVAAGSWLVSKNIVPQELFDSWVSEFTAVLVGLVILAIPVVWRYFNAKFNILALIKAVQTEPPADTPQEINAAVAKAQQDATDDLSVTTISA